MTRPSLASAVSALRSVDSRYPWVSPTDEEDDVAALLEAIAAEHAGSADQPDRSGHWGQCTGCPDLWPCPRFVWAQQLAVQFLGRAADRYAGRALATPTLQEVP